MENNEYTDYRKEPETVPPVTAPAPAPVANEPKKEKRSMNIWSCCSVVCVAIVLMFTLTTCGLFALVGKGSQRFGFDT